MWNTAEIDGTSKHAIFTHMLNQKSSTFYLTIYLHILSPYNGVNYCAT